jgi:hypothetical protein
MSGALNELSRAPLALVLLAHSARSVAPILDHEAPLCAVAACEVLQSCDVHFHSAAHMRRMLDSRPTHRYPRARSVAGLGVLPLPPKHVVGVTAGAPACSLHAQR